jgi:hypothetical protein
LFAGWSAFHPNLLCFADRTSIAAQKFDRQWRLSNCHHYPYHYPQACKLILIWPGFGGNSFLCVFGNRSSRGVRGGGSPPGTNNLGDPEEAGASPGNSRGKGGGGAGASPGKKQGGSGGGNSPGMGRQAPKGKRKSQGKSNKWPRMSGVRPCFLPVHWAGVGRAGN